MYTALLQVIIYQLAKYERDPMKNVREIAERSKWKRKKIIKNNKEKTIQQQKGLPTLSADLNSIQHSDTQTVTQFYNRIYLNTLTKCTTLNLTLN